MLKANLDGVQQVQAARSNGFYQNQLYRRTISESCKQENEFKPIFLEWWRSTNCIPEHIFQRKVVASQQRRFEQLYLLGQTHTCFCAKTRTTKEILQNPKWPAQRIAQWWSSQTCTVDNNWRNGWLELPVAWLWRWLHSRHCSSSSNKRPVWKSHKKFSNFCHWLRNVCDRSTEIRIDPSHFDWWTRRNSIGHFCQAFQQDCRLRYMLQRCHRRFFARLFSHIASCSRSFSTNFATRRNSLRTFNWKRFESTAFVSSVSQNFFVINLIPGIFSYCIDVGFAYNMINKKMRTSLRGLVYYYFNERIQSSDLGHCSYEDAWAALRLLKLKLENG